MQQSYTLLTILALLATSILYLQNQPQIEQTTNLKGALYREFQSWKQENGIEFDSTEEDYRFKVYQENKQWIQKFNQDKGYEAVRINAFAHLSLQEFTQTYMNQMKLTRNYRVQPEELQQDQERSLYFGDGELPTVVDWVSKGAVPAVVKSGSCSASYALQAANALSSLYFINKGSLVSLSAQQLIDCDSNQGGCRGGDEYYSYLYAMQYGIVTDESYPYVKAKKTCQYNSSNVFYTPQNAYWITYGKPDVMQRSVVSQPITTSLYADDQSFQFYSGGSNPYNTWCDSDVDPDYTVLVTGYNTTGKTPYWVIQTNLGTTWGNQGYMNIVMQKGSGLCEMNRYPNFPGWTRNPIN